MKHKLRINDGPNREQIMKVLFYGKSFEFTFNSQDIERYKKLYDITEKSFTLCAINKVEFNAGHPKRELMRFSTLLLGRNEIAINVQGQFNFTTCKGFVDITPLVKIEESVASHQVP